MATEARVPGVPRLFLTSYVNSLNGVTTLEMVTSNCSMIDINRGVRKCRGKMSVFNGTFQLNFIHDYYQHDQLFRCHCTLEKNNSSKRHIFIKKEREFFLSLR